MGKDSKKNVVVIGGGTGTAVVLEGLKNHPLNLSAIITTADDGSSSGVLRKEFDMIPPGDIRQCLVALASRDFNYLNERFKRGSVAGHTLGNLLITIFYDKHRDFQRAIDELLRITGAKGSLIPMTLRPTTLIARLNDNRELVGEKNITSSMEISKKLKKLYIRPVNIRANPRAISAIRKADFIIVGPGNLFSSIIPNFLIKEIREEFKSSRAKKIYIANLFTQPGHTDNFTILDFLNVLEQYIGEDAFTHVICNTTKINSSLTRKSDIVGEQVQIFKNTRAENRIIGRSIASSAVKEIESSDPIAKIRNPFFHDSKKIARVINAIMRES